MKCPKCDIPFDEIWLKKQDSNELRPTYLKFCYNCNEVYLLTPIKFKEIIVEREQSK